VVYKLKNNIGRWAGLAAGAALLALCLILLGGNVAVSQGGPQPRQSDVDRLDVPLHAAARFPSSIEQVNPGFTVDLSQDAVWGLVDPGGAVVVERTADGAYGAAEADATGFFWTPLWQSNGQPADVAGGDEIEVHVDGALEATIEVAGASGGIDVLADQVSGAIDGDTGGTTVTVTVGLMHEAEGEYPGANPPQETAVTDGGGTFTAAFADVDLGPVNWVAVEYGGGGQTMRSYFCPNDRGFAVHNLLFVRGYADPGQQVDVTVYEGGGPEVRWTGSATAGHPFGFYEIWMPMPGEEDAAQAGDRVEVELEGGEVLSTTLADLGITTVDPASDEIAGTGPAGETVTIRLWPLDGYAQTEAIVDGSGNFTADLSGIADLRTRDWFRLALADAEGNESVLISGAPFLDPQLGPRNPFDCAHWRVDAPQVPVTLTLETATDVYTRIMTSDAGNAGAAGYGCSVMWQDGMPTEFTAGDTLSLQSPSWEGSVEIADLSWHVDAANDEVTGQAPPGDVVVTARNWRADGYPIGGLDVQAATRAGSQYTAAFADFNVRDGGTLAVHHYDPTTDFGTFYDGFGTIEIQHFEAIIGDAVVGAPPAAGETVTASLYASDGSTLLAQTSDDEDDDPWRFLLRFGEERIEPGRWVTVTSESGWGGGLQVPDLTVQADAGTDLIWGEGPKALVYIEHGYDDDWNWSNHFVPVDGYVVDEAYFGADVQPGDTIRAFYQAPDGNLVQKALFWPRMGVHYGYDRVSGMYAVGHTLWLTVTDDAGAIKATATVTTSDAAAEDFAWSDGFTTEPSDWSTAPPNIQPDDRVHFRSDEGYSNTVRVGTITGEVDADANTIQGTIWAPWFSEPLQGAAGKWGLFWEEFQVDPNGGSYFVPFAEDIEPEQELDVLYTEPDLDIVINVFDGMSRAYLPIVLKDR
jgi:hypothetical protein